MNKQTKIIILLICLKFNVFKYFFGGVETPSSSHHKYATAIAARSVLDAHGYVL
jgi:hypothetical protein